MYDALLGKIREYKASILSMQGAINPTKNRDKIRPKHLKTSEMKPKAIKHTCYPYEPKMQTKRETKEEGCPSLMQDFKTPSSPLKILWILVVRRPTHEGIQSLTKEGTKGPNKA